MYTHICMCMYVCIYIYIYMYTYKVVVAPRRATTRGSRRAKCPYMSLSSVKQYYY